MPPRSRTKSLSRIGMPDEIVMRHRPPHFGHVFSGGGYAAAYYSYMWSEVLDADAFAAFEESGDIFDAATAKRLHDAIYSAGGRQDPAEAYKAFRGRLPSADALLRKRGFHRTGRGPLSMADLHSAGHRRGVVCAPHRGRRRSRPRDPRRRRQRARSHGGHGGDHRGRLSAHEPSRRRRLLADPRAVRPAARHHGARPRRAATRGRSFIATTRPSRRAGRSPRSPCRAPSAAGCWRCEAAKANGGKLPLDVLLSNAIRPRPRRLSGHAQPKAAHGKPSGRAQGRSGLCRDISGRRQGAGGRHHAEAAGARRDARTARPCRPRRFLSRRYRPRDRRRPRTHRQPGHARGFEALRGQDRRAAARRALLRHGLQHRRADPGHRLADDPRAVRPLGRDRGRKLRSHPRPGRGDQARASAPAIAPSPIRPSSRTRSTAISSRASSPAKR